MKRFCTLLAAVGMLALAAAAQDPDAAVRQMKANVEKLVAEAKVIGFGGAMGATVKGVPYSAVEVNESTQVLADGTRIHNELQTNVWRDSEGRVRRETPDQVTIWDPVANVSYFLNTKNQKGQKGTMNRVFAMRTSKDGEQLAQSTVTMKIEGQPEDSIPAEYAPKLFLYDPAGMKAEAELKAQKLAKKQKDSGNTESLGQQTIEGLPAEGTRTTTTLEAGTIGNDRPIQIVSERWYSPELQTVVMTRHNDPRTGEEIFRLTNVSRSEPPASLFQVPAGYQIQGQK